VEQVKGIGSFPLKNFNKCFKKDTKCWIGRLEMDMKVICEQELIGTGQFCGSAHFIGFSKKDGHPYALTEAHNFYLRKKHKLSDHYDEYFATNATFYLRKTEADDPYECQVVMNSI